jgi:hypothetical protein
MLEFASIALGDFSYGMQFWIMGRNIQINRYAKTTTTIKNKIDNQLLETTSTTSTTIFLPKNGSGHLKAL